MPVVPVFPDEVTKSTSVKLSRNTGTKCIVSI